MFTNLTRWFDKQNFRYPKIGRIVPGYVAIHWPSSSAPTLTGYTRIRKRAKRMTTEGEAGFFLASLLGYLDRQNVRLPDNTRKVLKARGGFFVHCLGHSFGGRFLAAAIRVAANPSERARKVLAAHRDTGFAFNVDSLSIFQMAAGHKSFQSEFADLLEGPLCGPIVLTHAAADRALCIWHRLIEFEQGVGCHGASDRIGTIEMRSIDVPYTETDFVKDITYVDASNYFVGGGLIEGAHSQIWHDESLHLIASVVEQTRSP